MRLKIVDCFIVVVMLGFVAAPVVYACTSEGQPVEAVESQQQASQEEPVQSAPPVYGPSTITEEVGQMLRTSNEALTELKQWLTAQAAPFVERETPLYIQEAIRLRTIISGVWTAVAGVVWVVVIAFTIPFWRGLRRDNWEQVWLAKEVSRLCKERDEEAFGANPGSERVRSMDNSIHAAETRLHDLKDNAPYRVGTQIGIIAAFVVCTALLAVPASYLAEATLAPRVFVVNHIQHLAR